MPGWAGSGRSSLIPPSEQWKESIEILFVPERQRGKEMLLFRHFVSVFVDCLIIDICQKHMYN